MGVYLNVSHSAHCIVISHLNGCGTSPCPNLELGLELLLRLTALLRRSPPCSVQSSWPPVYSLNKHVNSLCICSPSRKSKQ
jgi:hypothetical protein